MFNLLQSYRCTRDVKARDGRSFARQGDVLICVQDGARPLMSNGTNDFTAPAAVLARFFEPARLSELSESLKAEIDRRKNAPQLVKGNVVRSLKAISCSTDMMLPAGTLMRCQRGGKNPLFAKPVGDSLHQFIELSAPASDFALVEAVVSPALESVKVKVKVFETMSEETLAKSGTVTFGRNKVQFDNDGRGGCDRISGCTEALQELLFKALVADPATPYDSEAAVRESFTSDYAPPSLLELFLDYIVSSFYGLHTFGEYVMAFQSTLESESASTPTSH